MKKLPIDLEELCTAFEDGSGLEWYLDTETGDVFPTGDAIDDDMLPVPLEELHESDRFLMVEREGSSESFRDMEQFIATVSAPAIRQDLERALSEAKPFRRFKDALNSAGSERERWFAFADARLRKRAVDWLASQGIEAVPKA